MHCKWSVVCQKKMCIIRPPCLLVLSQERWHWYVYFFNKRSYKRRASFHALTYILYVLSKSVCHWSVELQIRDFSCLHYHWHCPHMLRGAGSMHLSGVRPSVLRPSVCPSQHGDKLAAAGLLMWQEISIDCCTAHSSAACRAVGECLVVSGIQTVLQWRHFNQTLGV